MSDMPRMRKTAWETRRNGSVPGSAGNGRSEPPQLEGLTDVPVSSSSNAQMPVIQPHLGFVQAQPELMSSFLSPESYLSDRRASPVSDAMGSLYAWSSTSDADMLRPAASSMGPTTSTSPFMQPYYSFGTSQPMVSPQIQNISGYTSQEINKWCMESDTSSEFYQPSNSCPSMNQLAFASPEIPSSVYLPLGEHMSTSEQWFTPIFAGPSTIPGPIPEAFLSPSSAPAVSVTSSSAMSTSPAPTLSDFESPSSRHRPASPPSNPADLTRYGIPAGEGVWRCAYPACTSQALFRRGCDLRKHFNRHRKHLFCRHEGCPQSKQGGFSSKKDCARHEAKHNPGIVCEWDGCGRVFSRVDNMKDHVRRIHRRGGSR
ncbi:ATP synthase subunit delta [Penicillium atrosanguineum]|nr:ATP synthase subunit delta [Penicillium atrosanguineum]KAJ5309435.1 ATP synthase subunit delta [Penicillium atrosanguineum]